MSFSKKEKGNASWGYSATAPPAYSSTATSDSDTQPKKSKLKPFRLPHLQDPTPKKTKLKQFRLNYTQGAESIENLLLKRQPSRSTLSSETSADDPWRSGNVLKKAPPSSILSSEKESEKDNKDDRWRPGPFRRFPWLGGLALFIFLVCAGAEAAILWITDGMEVTAWRFTPSVMLAILSAVARTCLQFAFSQGVSITWWRRAMKGATLQDLGRCYEYGDSIWAAVTSGRSFGLIALANILVAAVIIDGPLLQRASHVVTVQMLKEVAVTAQIAQELPYGYTGFGTWMGATQANLIMNDTFAKVFSAYITRDPIIAPFTGCDGNCSGIINAAGLAVNCSEESRDLVFANSVNQTSVFSSEFTWVCSKNTAECQSLVYTGNGGVMPFQDPTPMSFTTLGGVAVAAQNMFSSQAVQSSGRLALSGSLASQYIDFGTGDTSYFLNQDACAVTWSDPTVDIINALNNIMFRTSLLAWNISKYSMMDLTSDYGEDGWTNNYESWPVIIPENDTGMPLPQTIAMTQLFSANIYQSNYKYLNAALAIMLMGFLVVVPMFHGFWILGRASSLNPLEIAKAFDAELLSDKGSNAPIIALIDSGKTREVRYGEIFDEKHDFTRLEVKDAVLRRRDRRLGFAQPYQIKEPVSNTLYI